MPRFYTRCSYLALSACYEQTLQSFQSLSYITINYIIIAKIHYLHWLFVYLSCMCVAFLHCSCGQPETYMKWPTAFNMQAISLSSMQKKNPSKQFFPSFFDIFIITHSEPSSIVHNVPYIHRLSILQKILIFFCALKVLCLTKEMLCKLNKSVLNVKWNHGSKRE